MKKLLRSSSLQVTLIIVGLGITIASEAGNSNAGAAYPIIWGTLTEKGATPGRCNSIGVIGGMIVNSGETLPELVSACRAQECAELGVDLPTSIVDIATPLGDRFTNLNNGAVEDNATGLIWLADTNCFGRTTWAAANNFAAQLNPQATHSCNLNDDSQAGDWRLPTIAEFEDLVASSVERGYVSPALTDSTGDIQYPEYPYDLNNPWQYVNPNTIYWSSTDAVSDSSSAQTMSIEDGSIGVDPKSPFATIDYRFVWPVRNGEGPPDACQ